MADAARRRWPLALGAMALAVAAWWLARPPAGPRLVLVYATCTVNRDFLSPYNPDVSYTPALDRFARDGVVFARHHTESGQSGVAFASLLSGTQAARHGIYYHPNRVSDDVYLVGEAFRDAGYDTWFWSSHPMTGDALNYGQGIDAAQTIYATYDALPPNEKVLRADDARFQEILRHLREDSRARAFVLTTVTFTHAPYTDLSLDEFCTRHPVECAGRTRQEIARYTGIYWANFLRLQFAWEPTIAALGLSSEEAERLAAVVKLLYRSRVYWLDRRFGELVDAIDAAGLRDDSVIIFTADHGEQIESSIGGMRWTHGFVLAAEGIRVPLIVRAPGVPAGRIDAVTRSIDVFPTAAALAGLSLPAGAVEGTDLAPVLRGTEPAVDQLAFMHSSLLPDGMEPDSHAALLERFPRRDPDLMWVAVRDGDLVYKLTGPGDGTFALHVYDWTVDPGETRDLYDPADPTHDAMLKRLGAYKGRLTEGYAYRQAMEEGRVPSERQRELMRSLGYIE